MGLLFTQFTQNLFSILYLDTYLSVVSLNSVVVNGVAFTWGIVSRRSVHRAGTRLFSRGIDANGNVSNYVETEQLVEANGDRSSFVQTRGSIPLFWQQAPNLKYKPRPQLSPHEDHQIACSRHFDAQIFHYGRQILVNLVRTPTTEHNQNTKNVDSSRRLIIAGPRTCWRSLIGTWYRE